MTEYSHIPHPFNEVQSPYLYSHEPDQARENLIYIISACSKITAGNQRKVNLKYRKHPIRKQKTGIYIPLDPVKMEQTTTE
jgi:hypothetical protein